jgi:hypothetical protein
MTKEKCPNGKPGQLVPGLETCIIISIAIITTIIAMAVFTITSLLYHVHITNIHR